MNPAMAMGTAGGEQGQSWANLRAVLAVAALAMGFVAFSAAGHVDDTDGQLYQVVARNLARDRSWLAMRYLPEVHPHFREHLPFGLWPYAAAVRWLGEGQERRVAALFTLAAAVLVAGVAGRLAGPAAGLAAGATLVATESIFRYGGLPRLDPPLLLLTFASVAALWAGTARRPFLVAATLAALAALVKGPFGLLPLAAAGAARAIARRSPGDGARALLATVAAAAPAVVFLVVDRTAGDGSYWQGYLLDQVLPSATGARMDGTASALFPFQTLAGRFWPGLPFALWGAYRCIRERRHPELLLTTALMLIGLALPGRKVWNHALVIYPPLAVLAGIGAAAWLERISEPRRAIAAALAGGLALAVALSPLGDRVRPPRCVGSAELAAFLDRLPEGAPIAIVSGSDEWRLIASLAAERRLLPYPARELAAARPGPALVKEACWAVRTGWSEIARARGWVLATGATP